MKCGLEVPVLLLASALNAGEPAKILIFLAGAEPERISGEGFIGDSRGAVDLTRSAASYDIESMRVFTRNCPAVTLTTNREKANLILRVEREEASPITPFTKANRIAIFNREDELVYATRARLLGNASKDACKAILTYLRK